MRSSATWAAAIAAALPLLASRPAADAGETRAYRFLMGTSVHVQAFGKDDTTRREAIEEAFASVVEIDRLMSNYRGDSELSRVNAMAAERPVAVSAPLLRVLGAAQQISEDSRGAFDVSVGPLVKLWGFFDKRPHQPSAAELAAVRPLVNYRNIVIDRERGTIRFVRAGVEIDLGGIAKGFAVEVASNALRRRGLTGLVDAGGNQYMVGAPPGKKFWTVGIKDPTVEGRLLGVLDLDDGSASTSSDDSNFLTVDGRRYGHLLDPHSLMPSAASLSVTIVSRDGTLADAMSKAAFVLGPKDGLAFVDSHSGASALIAYRNADGTVGVVMSPALRARFHPAASRT